MRIHTHALTHRDTHTAPLHQLRHTQPTPAPCLLSSCPGWVLATQTSPQSLSQPLVHSEQTRFVRIQAAGDAVNPGCNPLLGILCVPSPELQNWKEAAPPQAQQVPEPFTLPLPAPPFSFSLLPSSPLFFPLLCSLKPALGTCFLCAGQWGGAAVGRGAQVPLLKRLTAPPVMRPRGWACSGSHKEGVAVGSGSG